MIDFHQKQHVYVSTYQQPKKGNTLCGDSYLVVESDDYVICAVSDGLGSGEPAHAASVTVMNVIKENHRKSVQMMVELCNEKLVAKRGVVLTIVKFDCRERTAYYSSIGNVGFLFYSPKGQMLRPIPNRGFLCGRKVGVKTECFPYEPGSVFVMYSDGVKLSGLKRENLIDLNSREKASHFIEKHVNTTDDDLAILIGQLL
ncbi:PP2C family serine/threonine-protein phosphatase [Alkalihalobacillus sp. BA299]|uniref:PP2C family serine/threonine-protein phosphatase n=1 Tax=Alkalihalobacillus sp. BA299 TaxID=2815938 RepID=UPI001ADB8736|nr:PP2C family serine/threonine-protein phosphatase [Alkalihalobacillus sp. BA299]